MGKTRPRGFAPWSPRSETLKLLAQVHGVLEEYRKYLPLTCRQVFYRLVGAHGYDKTERAYSRLCETLNRARRAGHIPFPVIRDDGMSCVEATAGCCGRPHVRWGCRKRPPTNCLEVGGKFEFVAGAATKFSTRDTSKFSQKNKGQPPRFKATSKSTLCPEVSWKHIVQWQATAPTVGHMLDLD